MRYAVISDIHANLEALTATLSLIDRIGVDRTICLGDIVGYHANPNECIELLRERRIETLAGNHDRAAAGLIDPSDFGEIAARAIRWTRAVLTRDNAAYLASLPLTLSIDDFVAVHGGWAPRPNERIHLSTPERAKRNLETLERRHAATLGFFGHTHIPIAYELEASSKGVARRPGPSLRLLPKRAYIVNPGSVGQSRDGDPRASFVLYDRHERALGWHRISYDRDSCFRKAREAGLAGSASGARLRAAPADPWS